VRDETGEEKRENRGGDRSRVAAEIRTDAKQLKNCVNEVGKAWVATIGGKALEANLQNPIDRKWHLAVEEMHDGE
jgi:hypothetical protein